jgi:hypothetical protein
MWEAGGALPYRFAGRAAERARQLDSNLLKQCSDDLKPNDRRQDSLVAC